MKVMTVKDEWLSAAMADDRVVAELLVRLKHSQAVSPLKSPLPLPVNLHLRWGIRQPRSRTATAVRCDVVFHRNKDVDFTRCSPTTPLSWSGGASPSATADGYEESSRPASLSHAASRFKGCAAIESTAATSATKRFKRKKTFAELKEEESMLLKEKLSLKKELALLRATFEEQRAKNESLKKMKMDFNLKYTKELSTNCHGPKETSSTQSPHLRESSNLKTTPTLPFSGLVSCEPQKNNSTEDCVFFLPDLNMTPSED